MCTISVFFIFSLTQIYSDTVSPIWGLLIACIGSLFLFRKFLLYLFSAALVQPQGLAISYDRNKIISFTNVITGTILVSVAQMNLTQVWNNDEFWADWLVLTNGIEDDIEGME